MSYRVPQLSPLGSTDRLRLSVAIGDPRDELSGLSDVKFLRSWLTYDSELDEGKPRGRVNWIAVLGMLLVLGISAGFWTGLGLLISHVRK